MISSRVSVLLVGRLFLIVQNLDLLDRAIRAQATGRIGAAVLVFLPSLLLHLLWRRERIRRSATATVEELMEILSHAVPD